MTYNWDWGVLLRDPYWGWLWTGLGWTLLLSLGSWVIALVVGITAGVARSMPGRVLPAVASVYIQVFRNVPPLVQLFLWYFVFPEVAPESLGLWIKRELPNPEFVTAIVGIGLFAGARVAEQVRAGVAAVGIRLMPAALATGLRPLQAYRLIMLPLGLRAIFGPLTSEFLITVKMSSISLTIGILELTAQSRHIENYTFHGLESFTVATVVYLVLGLAVTGLMRALDRRFGTCRRPAAAMSDFDWGVIARSWPFLAEGMALSALLVAVATAGGLVLGFGLALMRRSRRFLVAAPATAYVTVMRSVPLILVLFWFYFMVPLVIGRPVGSLAAALIAFVLFEAAFYCEIIRAGMSSVGAGQVQAALATGLRPWQVMRLVIVPQGLRAMTPLLLNQVIIVFQDTSLVSTRSKAARLPDDRKRRRLARRTAHRDVHARRRGLPGDLLFAVEDSRSLRKGSLAMIVLENVNKSYGRTQVLRDCTATGRPRRGGRRVRPVGLRQEHTDQMHRQRASCRF